jgi:hypothetical protein
VVLIHGVTPDGGGLNVLRARDGQLEAGAVRPLREGKPIHGEVVRLEPRESCPLVCDVKVDFAPPKSGEPCADGCGKDSCDAPTSAPHKGPARVASDAYRKNWDAIWARGKAN